MADKNIEFKSISPVQLIKAFLFSIKGPRQFYGWNIKAAAIRIKIHLREDDPVTFLCRLIKFSILRVNSLKYLFRWRLLKLRAKTRYVKKEVLGNQFYLDIDDPGISRELLCVGIREPYSSETMHKIIKPGEIALDIGGNIGYYALMEAKLVGEKGKVYAIEPVPHNVELLKKNIELNQYRNVEVFQAAVGAQNGREQILITSERNHCKISSPLTFVEGKVEKQEFVDEIPVEMITVDRFLEDRATPDLLRMDTEGFELEILKGARQLLDSKRPLKIYIEVHPSLLKKEGTISLLEMLKSFGFRATALIQEPSPYIWPALWPIKKIVDITNKRITGFNLGYLKESIDDLLRDEAFCKGEKLKGLAAFFARG